MSMLDESGLATSLDQYLESVEGSEHHEMYVKLTKGQFEAGILNIVDLVSN